MSARLGGRKGCRCRPDEHAFLSPCPGPNLYLDRRDWWVGYYRGDDYHYVCPIPCVVIRWARRKPGVLRRALFGERGQTLRPSDGIVWIVPGSVPIWRRPLLRRRVPDSWKAVGYTTEDPS